MAPFYRQPALGPDALMTGLFMTPWPLRRPWRLLAGRLANRVSTVWRCAVSGVCLAIGLLATALWPRQDPPLPLVPLTMFCLGFGIFQEACGAPRGWAAKLATNCNSAEPVGAFSHS